MPATSKKSSKKKISKKKVSRKPISLAAQPRISPRKINRMVPAVKASMDTKLNVALSNHIIASSADISEKVKGLLKSKPVDYRKAEKHSLLEYFDKTYLKSAGRFMTPDELAGLRQRLREASAGPVEELLELDSPLKEHPILGRQSRAEITREIGALIGLKGTKLQKFIDLDIRWDDLNEASILPLVKQKLVIQKQAVDLLFIGELARLTSDNLSLIKGIRTEGISETKQLLKWSKDLWVDVIKKYDVSIPEGEKSTATYIQKMMDSLRKTYADDVIIDETDSGSGNLELNLLKEVKELWDNNDKLIYGNCFEPNRINWKGVSAANKKKFANALAKLTTFCNLFVGLGLREIINEKELSFTKKNQQIKRLLKAFQTFKKNNQPRVSIKHFDFQEGKQNLNWTGVALALQKPVRQQMMATQRVLRIGEDPAVAMILLKTGFHSAMTIASTSEDEFFKCSQLDYEVGRRIYLKAKKTAGISANYFEAVRDGVLGTFNKLAANNQVSLVNDLRTIDGFDELFGNQDFCNCEHCRSILSPAAYFTDLMYFIQEHVSEKYFDPDQLSHPLYLKNRRPDLWSLELTCENTNTEIPYLNIVNEVLEAFIEEAEGVVDVYRFIEQANFSPQLPINIPLQELRIYLDYFDESLDGIFKALKQPASKVFAEKLRLSQSVTNIIRASKPNFNHKRFNEAALSNLKVTTFLDYQKISREELDQVLAATFYSVFSGINVVRQADPTDVQKFHEKITGLTKPKLDVLYRYLTFWKHTSWSIPEFDLLLNQLKAATNLTTLNSTSQNPKFLVVGQLVAIQQRLMLSVEELASVVHDIPSRVLVESRLPFYDRLFDREKLFGIASIAADGSVIYNAQAILPADKNTDDKTPLVIAGLGIDEPDLGKLFNLLNINSTLDIQVTHRALSNLYRQAVVARGLRWSVEEFVSACDLELSGSAVSSIDDIEKLLQFKDWLDLQSMSIADLLFILKAQESTGKFFETTNDSVAQLVFGFQQNQEQPDKLELLKEHILEKFTLTTEQLDVEYEVHLLSVKLTDASIALALNAQFDANDAPVDISEFSGLMIYLRELERWQTLSSTSEVGFEALGYMALNPQVYGVSDLKALTLSDLQQFSYYVSLVREFEEDAVDELKVVLTQYNNDGVFGQDSISRLAKIWQISSPVVSGVTATLTLGTIATEAVSDVLNTVTLAQKLGVEGLSLHKLTLTDFADIKVARDIVYGAISAKFSEEEAREKALERYQEKVHSVRRDALCEAILGKKDTYLFKDRSDLYSFFLLDVEMSGCYRTSRIVCAISSLQLYAHRCLINLEQSDPNLNPAIDDVKVAPSDIPEQEWVWRKNYRVWEANRKIFLYPENYIAPALRDTKSGIFSELEDELLQEKITGEAAEKAYRNYMAKFSALTRLRFAGAYYHSIPNDYGSMMVPNNQRVSFIPLQGTLFSSESPESLYYLFARTSTDPYQYYFRTYRHSTNTWGNWKKMNVAIDSEEISAVIQNGKLTVFWNSAVHKEVSKISGGDSQSVGHNFKVYTHYAYLQEDDSWTTPQKVFLGQFTESESLIIGRVGESASMSDDEKDKRMEYFVEEFQKKIIRRPYAIRNIDNTEAPIRLHHIWTESLGVTDVTYTAGGVTVAEAGGAFVASVPSASFTVINSDFSSLIPAQVIAVVDIEFDGITLLTAELPCEITLYSATNCVLSGNGSFKVTVVGIELSFPIILNLSLAVSANASSNPAKKTRHDLSLSKNEVLDADHRDLNDHQSVLQTSNFLHPEYLTAYSESGDYNQYVETGVTSFTDKYRKLHQSKEGSGHLLIADTSNVVDMVPATTILTDEILDVLYAKGLEEFLSLRTQNIVNHNGESFDMVGAYGEYYWEIFFHIPFLIASHLNANQKFKEAKWWYERIFNPTSDEDAGASESTDHYWQFREFKNLGESKLQDILSDTNAIEAYEQDPFDPHAIARLRITAYQKAVVMRYIDNLIDWGDYLFTRDTRESITEAMQYYQLALDLLGKRPVELGKCETADIEKLSYERLQDKIDEGSEFLISLENSYWVKKDYFFTNLNSVRSSKAVARWQGMQRKVQPTNMLAEVESATLFTDLLGPVRSAVRQSGQSLRGTVAVSARTAAPIAGLKRTAQIEKIDTGVSKFSAFAEPYEFIQPWKDSSRLTRGSVVENNPKRLNAFQLTQQSVLVFCIPENSDLLAYWDRVEDRMFKIRHCMNIDGVVRSLSLFSPPIDPNFLVRAAAAGLSLEDILSLVASAGQSPAYRFTYLIEKARQFASMVQGFGNSLLSAMEKKDVEELTQLRAVHEQNILKLTLDVRKIQLEEADAQQQASAESIKNVLNRIDYYSGLIDTGLIPWETTQQVSRHAATIMRTISTLFYAGGGIVHLIPQLGSPLAMKWGGKELGHSADSWGKFMNGLASIMDDISASAGLEAGFQRREEGWKHELKLASQEQKVANQQLLAAELRKTIAEKEVVVQEKSIEQSQELHDFNKNKFTSLGLYDFLSSSLNRLFREAYSLALDSAKLAEKAYQFETFSDRIFVANDNWESANAGLLSADRLLLQLAQMETAFIEQNVRIPEITQTFSLAILTPGQLNDLRQTGSCTIKIPEIAFEMFYPGQYRRTIRSVRVTVPSVVGPYTNVSAKLTLTKGEIELTDGAALVERPNGVNNSISTSGGENDSGMFEFNFRDERYFPFEGAGAISEWRFELPSTVRSFNYDTISDILITIGYTALEGDRIAAEAQLESELSAHATANGLYRLISLSHEMSNAFHQLMYPEAGAKHLTNFELTRSHFPYFTNRHNLTNQEITVYLKPKPELSVTFPTTFKINNIAVNAATSGDLAMTGSNGSQDMLKAGSVALGGTPITTWSLEANAGKFDPTVLDDLLILIHYQI